MTSPPTLPGDSMISRYSVTLPLPPSLNGMFRNVTGKGRVKTKHYRQWADAAGWDLKLSGVWAVRGPVHVIIYVPEKMPGDVDNRAKAVLDLLVTHRRIEDDKNVQTVTVMRADTVEPRKCRVSVWPADSKPTARTVLEAG